jgi:hypothetical protein
LGLKGAKDKKPNVAMLDTLRKKNEMFLAYNNGITALAKGIDSFENTERTDVTDPDSNSSSQYISMGILKKSLISVLSTEDRLLLLSSMLRTTATTRQTLTRR